MEDDKTIIHDLHVAGFDKFKTENALSPQSFYAVFDGHGGSECSAFLAARLCAHVAEHLESGCKTTSEDATLEEIDAFVKKAIHASFAKADLEYLENSKFTAAGSTGIITLILGHRVYACNVGDSRCVMCRGTEARPLSVDHKPNSEKELKRITDAGGFVFGNRVMGELAVSRAFGDKDFKLRKDGGTIDCITEATAKRLEESKSQSTNGTESFLSRAREADKIGTSRQVAGLSSRWSYPLQI